MPVMWDTPRKLVQHLTVVLVWHWRYTVSMAVLARRLGQSVSKVPGFEMSSQCAVVSMWTTGKLVTGSWRPRAHWCAWGAKGSYCSTGCGKIKCWLVSSSTSQLIMSDCFIPCGKNMTNNMLKHFSFFSCDGLQRFQWGQHIVFPLASPWNPFTISVIMLCALCSHLFPSKIKVTWLLLTTQRRWLGASFPHSGLLTTVWYTDRCCKVFRK